MDMSKYLFREVHEEDAFNIFKLAKEEGYHSDNLPRDLPLIEKDVHKSVNNLLLTQLGGTVKRPLFIFVLEDIETDEILGVSQIRDLPHRLLYRISFFQDDVFGDIALQREEDIWELGGLLLSEKLRGKGLGKLLSYGRLLYLLHRNISPRVLVSGFLAKDDFWNQIPTDVSEKEVERSWRGLHYVYHFFRSLPARIPLLDRGLVNAHIPIKQGAETARKLLTDMGLSFLAEIEARGILWYGAPWERVHMFVLQYQVSPDHIISDDCKKGYHTESAIAVLDSKEFQACYFPIQKKPEGFVYISENDAQLANMKNLYVF